MSKIKNIIFDFDGTLADTSSLIVATMQKSIKDYGLPFRNDNEIKATIGVRLEEIPSILWPDIPGIGDTFADVYRANFEKLKDKIPATLFPGVKETLSKLQAEGYGMGVATSRNHGSAEALTRQLGIREYFGCLIGGDDVKEGKPNAESIYKILKLMDWRENETMMTGDMAVDIQMGKNAGIKTCGVTYGNGTLSELEGIGSDFIIHEITNLPNVLED